MFSSLKVELFLGCLETLSTVSLFKNLLSSKNHHVFVLEITIFEDLTLFIHFYECLALSQSK